MFTSVVVAVVLSPSVLVATIIAIQIHVNMDHANKIPFLLPDSFASVTKGGQENIVNTDHVTISRVTIKVSQLITVTRINASAVVPVESVAIIVK